MTALLAFAVLWLALHLGVSGTALRGALVGRIGENPFRGLFSLAALVLIVALCLAYARSETVPLWFAPEWLRWALVALMLPACVLLAGSFARGPTAAGGEKLPGGEVKGMQRITRHPMNMAFAIWAAVHVIGTGDAAGLVLFGTFFITAAAGMPSIDRKSAARDPAGWVAFAHVTSVLPFAAILSGRNRLAAAEIGWLVPLAGLVLWVALLVFHRGIFGVAPVPI
jgi:uncharacterized membrane protein